MNIRVVAMAGLHEGGTVGSMLITAIVRHAERAW